MMEFSSPVLSGTLPSPRSWHASAVLPQQRIFIHGGYDGEQILTDSFVLELGEFNFFLYWCTCRQLTNVIDYIFWCIMYDPLLVPKYVIYLKSKYFRVYLFVKIPSPHPWRDPVPL